MTTTMTTATATIRRDVFDREFTQRVHSLHIPDDSKSKVLWFTDEVLRACTVGVSTSSAQTDAEFWRVSRFGDVAKIDECKELVALDLATPTSAGRKQQLLPMPTCIGCGMDTKMKCIWLSEREQEAFKRHPWMCLKCTVRNPIESIVPGMMDRNANMCIWFNQVTRLKAKYTEFKILPNDETALGAPAEPEPEPEPEAEHKQVPMLAGQAHQDSLKGVHCAYGFPSD